MAVSYDDVRSWDAQAVDRSATHLQGRKNQLIGLQDELDDARRLPNWHGPTGESARTSLRTTRNNAEILVAELAAVERALQNAADDVEVKILDGMDEIREDEDGNGIVKSYYLLPTGISGEDAAKAVRMTYIVNAGTDYGTEGEATDFAPTPYGSEERRVHSTHQRHISIR